MQSDMEDNKTRDMIGKNGEALVAQLLTSLLKDGEKLLNDVVLKHRDSLHQIDHILLKKNGLFCVETKSTSGEIYGRFSDPTWTIYSRYTRKVTKIMNPMRQNSSHICAIKSVIGEKYHIESVLVFPRATLKVLGYGILAFEELAAYINDNNIYPEYESQELAWIYHKLTENNLRGKVSRSKIIESSKNYIDGIKKSMKCPRCGADLVIKNGARERFYSCSRYPKCSFAMDYYEGEK